MDVTAVGGLRFGTITAIPGGGRQGQQFAVAQDQMLEGTVVSIDHESVVIQVGNQRMRATTDASVRPGDLLRLLVRAAGPDQVLMQIVGRGGMAPLQTRSFTRQELSGELTRLGVAPDSESLQVAGELLARGQPLTAEGVLEVRSALTRVAQARAQLAAPNAEVPAADAEIAPPDGSLAADAPEVTSNASGPLARRAAERAGTAGTNQADLRAAVFLKAQGLPVTPAAVQIVRQAWSSSSALGEEVQQLRDGLASLASRLVGLAETSDVPGAPAPASSGVVLTTAAEPELSPHQAGPSLRTLTAEAPQAAGAVETPETPETPPPRVTPEQAGASGQVSPERSPPSSPSAAPREVDARAAQTAFAIPSEPADASTGVQTGRAPGQSIENAEDGLPAPASSGTPAQRSPPAQPAPSIGRLLTAVAESLGRLQVIDDEAVAGSRQELAARIQQVMAEQGTPVEAKLARVIEGMAERSVPIDRALVADLRTALTDLVDEVGRHLAQPDDGSRLPPEARRDLESVRAHAETILGRVELQQLSNAAPTAPGDPSYLMFQLPIPGGREGQTAQIRIRQEDDGGGAKRIDPKNAHVVFQFDLQNLGTVRVSLKVLDRRVACHMGSTDAAATALLDRHAGELREGLGELGYVVDDLRCAQLTAADLRAPEAAAGAAPPPPRPSLRVDARA